MARTEICRVDFRSGNFKEVGLFTLEAGDLTGTVTIPSDCTVALASVNVGSTGSYVELVTISGSALTITMNVANEGTAITGSFFVG